MPQIQPTVARLYTRIATHPRVERYRAIGLPALLFVLALALRVYALERQSLWADEGSAIALASRSFSQIFRDTAVDAHPPLYYWLLHVWMRMFGTSVFAIRSFSAACGALTVSLTYILGRRWFGRPAALLAAVAALLSPLAVHYSQETRMYALATLLGALAWLGFDEWQSRPRPTALALFWCAALAAMCTHYFAAALIAAANLIWAIGLICRLRQPRALPLRQIAAWITAQALLGAVYLPLVLRNRATLLNWPTIPRGEYGPAYVLSDVLHAFSHGPASAPGLSGWSLGCLLLLIAGLAAQPRQPGRHDRQAWAAAWLFVPIGLMLAMALKQPLYQPRFLLPALPAYHLLVGHGAAQLGRRLRAAQLVAAATVIFLALAARAPLQNEWFNSAYWRDDYRGIAHDIAITGGPADALLFMGLSPLETFDYYYDGPQPRLLLPRARPLDPQATIRDLADIAQRYRRLYTFFYVPYEADPTGVIAGWLRHNAFMSSNRWYGGVELATYELGEPRSPPRDINVQFGERLQIARAVVDPVVTHPKDAVRVLLEWRAIDLTGQRLSIFVHLLGSAGQIVGQYDVPLLGEVAAEPSNNQTGQTRLAVPIPPDTPPGTYRLVFGVYDPASGARLRLTNGDDRNEISEITVAPS